MTALLSRAVIAAICTLAAVPALACGPQRLADGQVAGIGDGGTLVLQDGRRIALAGLVWTAPPPAVRAALAAELMRRTVALTGDATADRHGRLHAFPIVSGSETPIQYALLERGLALASGRIGNQTCRALMLRAEQAARAAAAGLWAGTGGLHRADDPGAILADRGRFRIVEGRVQSVRERGSTIYVNFSRRWASDFTVTIAKKHQAAFISAGLLPRDLAGRTVRIRGYIDERAGPWIEATAPGQVELVDGR